MLICPKTRTREFRKVPKFSTPPLQKSAKIQYTNKDLINNKDLNIILVMKTRPVTQTKPFFFIPIDTLTILANIPTESAT